MPTPLEKDVQRTICEWLEVNKYFFWRSNNIPVFSRNNAGKMAFRSLGKYTPRGIPDIILIIRGLFIGVEVKREGVKTLREEQETFKYNIENNGGRYWVVHSIEELKGKIDDFYTEMCFGPR